MKINLERYCKEYNFKSLFEQKGYAYFEKGYYNLNIIGVRNNQKNVSNAFDDCLVVIYRSKLGNIIRKIYSVTTKPGLKPMKQPQNPKGCAILVPNQYRGCWKIGLHKGKYEALVQNKPVTVYRDNDKDSKFDLLPISMDNGIFGINIHRAGNSSTLVDGWSAGCTVFANKSDFEEFMSICKKQIANGYGKTFTYTLLNLDEM